jgi:condensin complex subunit 2
MEGHRVGRSKSSRSSCYQFGQSANIIRQIKAPPQSNAPEDPAAKAVDGSLNFTDVVNSLQTVYPQKAMADLSTSYCFICVLHLANEKGLVIENTDNYENLVIRKDFTADLSTGE